MSDALIARPILTLEEQSRRDQLERVIDRHLESFVETAIALAEIKRDHLWRNTHDSFTHYCADKFGRAKTQAYDLAGAGEVLASLSGMAEPLPTSNRQVQPLRNLEPEQQQEAWRAAVATAPEGKITETKVAKAVEAIKTAKPAVEVGQTLAVQCGEYQGETVTVQAIEGVVVQCVDESGNAIALLTTELIPPESSVQSNRTPKQGQASELIAQLETKLQIERVRTEMLETLLRKCLPLLPIGELRQDVAAVL